jgi:hypothetical protein
MHFHCRFFRGPFREKSSALCEYAGKSLAVRSKIHIIADAHHGPANQPRLLDHEFYEFVIAERFSFHTAIFETGAAKIEHFGGRSALQQILDLGTAERILEKIAFFDFNPLLQEKLPRLPAGASLDPAIEVYHHGLASSLPLRI